MQRLTSTLGQYRLFRGLSHPYTRRAFRIGRTVALGGGIYGAGYASGLHDAIADPAGVTETLLAQVLSKRGPAGKDSNVMPRSSREAQVVERLGGEIVHAAKELLASELEAAQQKRNSDDPATAKESDEAVVRLTSKLRATDREWKFIVIDDQTINAFVTDLLPGYVFVHRGLVDLYRGKPEELSFVLGHELSHYLLDHGSKDREMDMSLSLLQLVVFAAIDPTGLVSFLAELGAMSSLFKYTMTLPASRSHESEADTLGLQLAVRACRDPRKAIKAHKDLADYETAHGRDPEHTSLGASHPATLKRLEDLQQLLPEAVQQYEQGGCHLRRKQLEMAKAKGGLRLGRRHASEW